MEDSEPLLSVDNATSSKLFTKESEGLVVKLMSWINQMMMHESKLDALPAELCVVKCPNGVLYIPTDPRVISVCNEHWLPKQKSLESFCNGPAYVYSVLARRIMWTSILFLSIVVFCSAQCHKDIGSAKYPHWILIPVGILAIMVHFLECQALRFCCLPSVLNTEGLKLPLIGFTSYFQWVTFRGLTSFVQVFSAHTSAFLVSQTLKGIYMCNSSALAQKWNAFFGNLPMNFKLINPGVILLILWILGTYSFWRAWFQSTIYPWIKPGHFPGIRKAWGKEFPDDIDSGPYQKEDIGEGTINYTPKVAFGRRGHKKEVKWRSMAYKTQLDDWWVNFSQGLAGNARVCGWTAVQAGEYEGPLATARRSQMQKDTNRFWYKSCVNEAFYVNSRTLANLLDSIFFKGVLPLNFQVLLFKIDNQMEQTEGDIVLFRHIRIHECNFQVLLCILLSFATLVLSEALMFSTTVKGSYRLLLDVHENVQSTREHLQKKRVAEAERFATEGPTDAEKDGLKMVKDYDHAWKLFKWIVVCGTICTLLFANAVVMMIMALLA